MAFSATVYASELKPMMPLLISSSLMNMDAFARPRTAPLLGFDRISSTDSSISGIVSLITVTLKVLFVWPSAKLRNPLVST